MGSSKPKKTISSLSLLSINDNHHILGTTHVSPELYWPLAVYLLLVLGLARVQRCYVSVREAISINNRNLKYLAKIGMHDVLINILYLLSSIQGQTVDYTPELT